MTKRKKTVVKSFGVEKIIWPRWNRSYQSDCDFVQPAIEATQEIVSDLTTDMTLPIRKVEPRKEGADPKWAIQIENKK